MRAVEQALQKAGVEFIVIKRAARVKLRKSTSLPAAAAAATGAGAAALTHSVLVVNSAPEVRSLARSILEELRLNVIEAESGEEALMILQEQAINLSAVFSEAIMPGMDGIILANIIMKTWPAIKVILSTGAVSVFEKQLPPNADVIAKPWRISEMFRIFKSV